MTEVERLTAGSPYPLGRDPEWEARTAGLIPRLPASSATTVDMQWPSGGAWNDPWEAEAKWRTENPKEAS